MKHMGWSYDELKRTPAHVVERIWAFMQTEAKWEEIQLKRAKDGSIGT